MEAVLEFLKNEWFLAIGGFLWMVFEYWLGKTTLVKPGSTLEMIFAGGKKILEMFGFGTKE